MTGDELRDELRGAEVPDAAGAEERSWQVVSAAYAEREAGAAPLGAGRVPRRIALVAAIAAAAAGLVLTPAGADVREWVAEAIDGGATVERQALTRLPTGGEVLVTSSPGAWLVHEDGSRRLLGDYEEATFSPQGLYVAASRENKLTAVDPEGAVRWSISRPGAIADPRWAPSGYRVAFREGGGLSVVAGDGTDPRELIDAVKPTAPSWRPPPEGTDPRYGPNVLTYVQSRSIHTVDVDTGRELWHQNTLRRAKSVEWAGPDRLIVSNANNVRVFDRRGNLVGSPPLPHRTYVDSVAASPDGERLAVVVRDATITPDARSRLVLARIAGGERRERTVFSGFGRFGSPVFSPDGEWILLPWEDTDQWLFISPSEDRKLLRRVIAVGDIARQFDPGGRGTAPAPSVEGWCCG